MRATYEESFARGRITAEECDARLGSIRGATDYRELAEADLVIEAVFEEMDVKHKVFAKARRGVLGQGHPRHQHLDSRRRCHRRRDERIPRASSAFTSSLPRTS